MRIDGPTPAGGDTSEVTFMNELGHRCSAEDAVTVKVAEYAGGRLLSETSLDRKPKKKRGAPMSETLHRSFEVAAVEVEGRTVDVRVVPFGEVARVADPPDYEPYEEEWLPGCFDHQLNAANRIHANYEHGKGITDVVGHGVSLRAESDGYHITSTIHRTNSGDTALELINAGALPSVSLEALPARNVTRGNVVQRAKAHLRGFAFCRQGAFMGAQVLAVRAGEPEDEPQTLDADLLVSDLDPRLVERCRRLGITIPQRYAHPANTDTPTSVDTSVDGTREFGDHYVAYFATPNSTEE